MFCKIAIRLMSLPGVYRCGVAMGAGRGHRAYRCARFAITGYTGRYQVGRLWK